MGSPGVAGLLSLALSDCVSVRISLPPSLIVFIRFIPSGFSYSKERVEEQKGGGKGVGEEHKRKKGSTDNVKACN